MTRSQDTAVYNTATSNSKTDQDNAQTALGGVQTALGGYTTAMGDFVANDPYKAGGEYEQDEKNITGARASADSTALQTELNMSAQRSGENTASYAPALAKATRDATVDASTEQSQAEADRLNKESAYGAQEVQMSQFPVQTEQNIYSSSLSGANQALGTAASAANANKSFGDTFGNAFAGDLAKGAVGAASAEAGGAEDAQVARQDVSAPLGDEDPEGVEGDAIDPTEGPVYG